MPEINVWRAVTILLALAVFGYLYNRWVAGLVSEGHDRGYMGFIVALGCGVVILGWMLITVDLAGALILLAAFAAAGVPMILGSIERYVRAQDAAARALREDTERLLSDGD